MALYEAILLDIQQENENANKEDVLRITAALTDIDKKIKKVQDKWFEGVLDDNAFKDMNAKLLAEKNNLQLRLTDYKEQPKKKELDEKLKYALAFIENMGYCVANSPIDLKLNILGSIFSGKIVFENLQPRTESLSPLVSLITGNSRDYKGIKTKKPLSNDKSFSRGG